MTVRAVGATLRAVRAIYSRGHRYPELATTISIADVSN